MQGFSGCTRVRAFGAERRIRCAKRQWSSSRREEETCGVYVHVYDAIFPNAGAVRAVNCSVIMTLVSMVVMRCVGYDGFMS